jgi:hypothetical protein
VNSLFVAAMLSLFAQTGPPGTQDPLFSTIPFHQWLSRTGETQMHWSVRISQPTLSSHQRLAVNIEVQVDGAELARRRGEGQFMVLVQLEDEQNHTWQNHQELDLEQIQEQIKAANGLFTQSLFILPGKYRVSVAVFDNATGEHSVIQRNLHIPPLKKDPLPEMWRDLPAVEFLVPDSSSDRWYLPSVTGRLRLPVETRHPVDVDLLVNLTASERLSASTRTRNSNLAALIPATKVLSQMALSQTAWQSSTFNIEFLDLARRRVAFRQDKMQTLDWPRARSALDSANPGIIDVHSLGNRSYNADFFVNRIARRIGAKQEAGTTRVVIVLSALVFFEPGVEMRPIGIAPRPDVKVIYIRYQPRQPSSFNADGRPRRNYIVGPDELEPLLRPLEPRLFDVATPEQFRKSLAMILDEIARL